MAITATQVTWSAANTLSVTSATEVVSDVIDFSSLTLGQPLSIQLHANNAGTPASGDTAVWRIKWSNGDTRNDSGDDYDTTEHSDYLMTLDTFATNTPGENPSTRTTTIFVGATKAKLSCTCANAATRNMTIAARYAI